MNTARSKFILVFSILGLAAAMNLAANPKDSSISDSTEEVPVDSVEITTDSLFNRALESFKNVKFLKFEGEALDVVSPAAANAVEQCVEVLPLLERNSREYMRMKEVLRELDRDLLAAAFFYSSAGNQAELNRYARAYLDVQLLPDFDGDKWENDPAVLAMIAYIAASDAYNSQDYKSAIDYFKVYLSTGDDKHREAVYLFMAQSCLKAGEYELGIATADEGLKIFPAQKQLMLLGMQMCIDGGRGEKLQNFLTQALTLQPTDEQLLNIQGKLLEDEGEYEKALGVYNTLDEIKPNLLSTQKHIGLCYYNLAVDYFNKAINQADEKIAARNRRQAKNYFAAAADKFREILASAPTSVPYLRSLGVCYLCLEDKYNFDKINEKLIILNEDPLSNVFMPPTMTYEGSGPNFARKSGGALNDAPSYSQFAADYITSRLESWVKKGEFERMDDYSQRVNDNTILAEYNRLNAQAADEYLKTYANRLRLNDLALQPYDATNEVFKITSSYGPIYLDVPLKNNEAENFKNGFSGIRFQNPSYFIDNDSVRIAGITFITPQGKQYTFDNARAKNYSNPDVYIDFAAIINKGKGGKATSAGGGEQYVITAKSDVDKDIPVSKKSSPKTLALIIANENYKHVQNVPAAIADGSTFAEYCRQTLGLPEGNVALYRNASYAELLDAVSDLQRKADVLGPEAEIIVYYAGHGLPDENTKDAYILSTDANPSNPRTWYKLADLYSTLAGIDASSVMVFIDACFSGSERDGGMLAASAGARAVAIKAKEAAPKGNMFVMTAASGNETALPYKEKNHGMFTYYLLKKIQETKGNVTLKDLSDYVIENVRHQSNFINHKPQTPTVSTSGRMTDGYKSQKLVR